jgi:hypothetical protein
MNILHKLTLCFLFPVAALAGNSQQPENTSIINAVENGNPIEIELKNRFLQSIDVLKNHAHDPSANQKYLLPAIEFCDCTLIKVLDESDNRQTLFFKPNKPTVTSVIMVTVWHYKKDGAEMDFSRAFNNAKVNDKKASFSVARNPAAPGAMMKIMWAIEESLPSATSVEMMAKMDVYSVENLKELSKIMGRGASLIDKNIRLNR